MAADAVIDGVDTGGMHEYLLDTPVVYAVCFGSSVRGDSTSTSDVDVALQFPDELDDRERFDARNRIDAELQSYAERFVDVSDVERLPVRIAARALRDGRVLYGDEDLAADDRKRFEEQVAADADDRKRQRRDVIDRLAEGSS
ncbi:nucleotidyltransferase domain-containing protein [Salinarchaeum chitinilyticum]